VKSLQELLNGLTEELKKATQLPPKKGPFVVVRQFTTFFETELLKRVGKPTFCQFCGTTKELAINRLNANFKRVRVLSDQERFLLIKEAYRRVNGEEPTTVKAELIDKRLRNVAQSEVELQKLEELTVRDQLPPRTKEKIKETVRLLKVYEQLQKKLSGRDFTFLLKEARAAEPKEEISSVAVPVPGVVFPTEAKFINSLNCPKTVYRFPSKHPLIEKLQRDNERFIEANFEELEKNPLSDVLTEEVRNSPTKVWKKEFESQLENVQNVVNGVKQMLKEGLMPHEIAVVGSDLSPLLPVLYEAFKKEGIPFRFQTKGIPLSATPAVKSFLNALKGAAKSDKRKTLPEWIKELKDEIAKKKGELDRVYLQIAKLYEEIETLGETEVVSFKKINGQECHQELLYLLKNRYFLIEENHPLGVHVSTVESAPTLMPKGIIFVDLSEGTYPRAFPYDPDFSYQERELINRLLKLKLIDQLLPTRERLIAFDLLTFHNLLSLPTLRYFLFTVNGKKGDSLFGYLLSKNHTTAELEEYYPKVAIECLKQFVEEDDPPAPPHPKARVKGWKEESLNRFFVIEKKELFANYLKELSPTDLETYRSCPLKFFRRKVLGYKEEQSVQALEGSLYHEVAREVVKNNSLLLPDEKLKETVQKAVEEILKRYEEELKEKFPELLQLKDQVVKKSTFFIENLKEFLKETVGELKNAQFYPEKEVGTQLKTTKLKGFIDLLVKQGDKTVIIDYKHTKGKLEEKKYLLQLSCYHLINEREEPGKEHHAYLFKINRQEFVKVTPNRELTDKAIALARSGFFVPVKLTFGRNNRVSLRSRRLCQSDVPVESYLSRELKERLEKKINEILKG
jgi:RecB family exonuclease